MDFLLSSGNTDTLEITTQLQRNQKLADRPLPPSFFFKDSKGVPQTVPLKWVEERHLMHIIIILLQLYKIQNRKNNMITEDQFKNATLKINQDASSTWDNLHGPPNLPTLNPCAMHVRMGNRCCCTSAPLQYSSIKQDNKSTNRSEYLQSRSHHSAW